MIFDLLTALFVDSSDKVLGTTDQTKDKIAQSNLQNQEADEVMYKIGSANNKVWSELADGTFFAAESIKNDNLRLQKEIEKERREILNT